MINYGVQSVKVYYITVNTVIYAAKKIMRFCRFD